MFHNSNPKPSCHYSFKHSQMDKPLAIHDRRTSKPRRHRQDPQKPKRKQVKGQQAPTNAPVKVVYIGSPVNFSTSASEFRSLVQQLTGKDNTTVGGRQQHHQESPLDSAAHASVLEVRLDPAENKRAADDHEAEDIASASSLNCPTNNSNLLDIGHHDDDVYTMPDQMLDDYYLPPDFWYDQY